jgi:hypothetical protein
MSLKSVKNLWRHLFAPLVVLITASGLQGVQQEKEREGKRKQRQGREETFLLHCRSQHTSSHADTYGADGHHICDFSSVDHTNVADSDRSCKGHFMHDTIMFSA